MPARHLATTALALAGFWMLLWASFGAVLSGTVARLIDPAVIGPGEGPADVVRILAGVGVVAGAAFGVLLAVAERGRILAEVPVLRVLLWGVLAGSARRAVGGAIRGECEACAAALVLNDLIAGSEDPASMSQPA